MNEDYTDWMVKILAVAEVLNIVFALIGAIGFSDNIRYFFIFKMVMSFMNVGLQLLLTYRKREYFGDTNW